MGTLGELGGSAAAAVPSDVIPRLTTVARRFAAQNAEDRPATISAVLTTHGKAVEALGLADGNFTRPASPVYVVVMTGQFMLYRFPYGVPPPTGSVLTLVLEARRLDLLSMLLNDQDVPVPA